MSRRGVAVLSASGLVGQRFQERLHEHPWFELKAVVGSPASAGLNLSQIEWRLESARPELPDLQILALDSGGLVTELTQTGVEIVFSALPSQYAAVYEPMLSLAGFIVLSNASSHRRLAGVPLVVADLNPHHLKYWKGSELGAIACSTNCTVIPIALPLKPLWDMVGFSSVKVRTEQALSGAGWRLLKDQKALSGQLDPEIPGEAARVAAELLHLLGRLEEENVRPASFSIEVECKRVAEKDGHLVHVEVELKREVEPEEIIEWMSAWADRPQHLKLPSAPTLPLLIIDDIPNRDRHLWAGAENTEGFDLKAGMTVVVGGISVEGRCLRFSALSHNTVRGAAGGCLLLGELLIAEGLIEDLL